MMGPHSLSESSIGIIARESLVMHAGARSVGYEGGMVFLIDKLTGCDHVVS